MKIAYCCNSFYSHSETFVRDLSLGLEEVGHEVGVFADHVTSLGETHCERFSVVEDLRISDNSIAASIRSRISSLMGSSVDEYLGEWRLKNYSSRAYSKIKEFKPDVIYADYGTKGVLLTQLAREIGAPLVIHFHGYDLSSALVSNWYRRRLDVLDPRLTSFIVPSHHLRRLLAITAGIRENVHVIGCDPNIGEYSLRETSCRSACPTVVFLGRLTPKKNPLALIEAFYLVQQQVRGVRLEIVGDGPERARLESRIDRLGIRDSVTLHGALAHEDALRILAQGWAFAQHSVTSLDGDQEGLPVSILESLAMGLPVVSTIHSGISEAVADGVNGFLVKEHDYEMMADRLVTTLLNPGVLSYDPAKVPEPLHPLGRVKAIEMIMEEVVDGTF